MSPADIRWMRFSLATLWLATGIVTLFLYPKEESYTLLARAGFFGTFADVALYGGALADMALGVMTLSVRRKWLWALQAFLIILYTLVITIRLPEFWIHPFGPILKNLPIFALLWLLYKNDEERV
ncbi:MAG: dehydrogenase [Paucimonas sp.]|jgi:hypothetical protein|nr:dehydrogenase [Paucimonas sp.]